MYRPLVPCPGCARHVLTTETACPFCAAELPRDLADRAIPSTPVRLSRAAAFVFGATLAVTGCGSDVSAPGDSSGGTGGSSSASTGGPDDDGGAQAHYGTPAPVDAGPDDDGGGQALYGDPAPIDAGGGGAGGAGGGDGSGGAVPLYGSPPPPPKEG